MCVRDQPGVPAPLGRPAAPPVPATRRPAPPSAARTWCMGASARQCCRSPATGPCRHSSVAAACLAGIAYTAEPTNINTVALLQFGFNQRGGMRWAVPQGEGIKCMNSFTEKGLVWTVVSSAAGVVDANMHWWE